LSIKFATEIIRPIYAICFKNSLVEQGVRSMLHSRKVQGSSLGGFMKLTSLLALPFLLLFLLSCKTTPQIGENPPELFELPPTVIWGTAVDKPIYAGGFSGLIYLGKNPKNSEHQFMTITDRGPNIDPKDKFRTFLLPTYQPRLVKLETNRKAKTISIIGEILFTDPKGDAITGLPQIDSDQAPMDPAGNPLPFDPLGMDSESLAVDKDGNYQPGKQQVCRKNHRR